jgi:hypothetical protein
MTSGAGNKVTINKLEVRYFGSTPCFTERGKRSSLFQILQSYLVYLCLKTDPKKHLKNWIYFLLDFKLYQEE